MLAGTLRAPRLFPQGSLLWILPHHSRGFSSGGALSSREMSASSLERRRSMEQQDEDLELRYVLPEAFDKLFIFKQAFVRAVLLKIIMFGYRWINVQS